MRVHLIFNGASGRGADQDDVERRMRDLGATLVDAPADAERIVAWGGDGTIAPAAALAAGHGLPLGIVPGGTANDFASAARLPKDHAAALRLAVTGTRTRRLELGRVGDRPFVNTASVGLAAEAGARAAPLKSVLRAAAYPVGAVLAGVLEAPVKLEVDGHFGGRVWQLTAACTGAFGGGVELEAADPHDGLIDLLVVPARSRRDLPGVGLSMVRGVLAERDDVLHVRARSFTVRLPAGARINVDGELLDADGETTLAVSEHFALVYDIGPVDA